MGGPTRVENVTMEVLLVAAGSVCVTAAAVPVCIRLARRWGVIDRPGPLKTQKTAVPYLGGVAVFAGLIVGGWVGRPVVLIPVAVAAAVGVYDDRFGLPAPLRLAAQVGVGAIIAAIQPVHLPGWVGVPLVMAVSVVLINGFNLLDGLDMLAAGVALAASVGFAVVTHGPARLLAGSLIGALAAFLWSNRPPARIYLGDGGSYLLGASMTVLLTYAWGVGVDDAHGVIALALLVVPIAEVACAAIRRGRSGRSLMAGDRSHPYDLLVARGWPPLAASGAYFAVETIVVVVAIVAVIGHASVRTALGIDLAVAVSVLGAAALVGGLSDAAGTSR
jgi:UDP-GlcNAc:undecaprenyl-phosphate/decaprenyl-phosphate GlcNAc-1-phosphate transferase